MSGRSGSQVKRMDGYVRVSRRMGREGPGYISPDVQREAIQRWADYRGVEIAEWHVDEDQSGGSQDRPGMRRIMARIASGETDGVAVWKIDRFARNVHEAIRDVKAMQQRAAGPAMFASVTEDIDPTGPFGDFVLTIMLAVATLQRDSLVAGWKIAKGRAHERGAKIGPTPVGYTREADGTLEPHPEHAAVIAHAFAAAASGGIHDALGVLQAAHLTHDGGAREGRARRWTATTVRRILENRAYLGEAHYEGLPVNRDAHPAIVDLPTWTAAQPPAAIARQAPANYPLSGLARCGSCGTHMVGGTGGKGIRVYRCAAALKTHAGEQCTAGASMTAERLEGYVRDWLADHLSGDWTSADADDEELVAAGAALREAQREHDDVATDVELRRAMGAERFARFVEATNATLEEAQARYRAAAASAARGVVVVERELVLGADLEELGILARGPLDGIVVAKGRGGDVASRVRMDVHGDESQARVPAAQDGQDGSVGP